jgi:hypothetical protein
MSRHGMQVDIDVHTEHCCQLHGCKYGSWQGPCTVKDEQKPQSFMCEWCYDWLEENWDLVLLLNEMFDKGLAAGLRKAGMSG